MGAPVTTRGRIRAGLTALLLLLCSLYAWLTLGFSVVRPSGRQFLLLDDAMISLRNARNLVDGVGLVWSAGDRVQGFTNLGWTLVMAATQALVVDERLVPLAVVLINAALHAGIVIAVFRGARRSTGAEWAAWLGAITAATSTALVYWGAAGFETSILGALLLAGYWPMLRLAAAREGAPVAIDATFARQLRMAPVVLALAVVVRCDAGIHLPVAIIGSVVAAPPPLRRAVWRSSVGGALWALAVVAALLLFQHGYYGDWLPNTYYLKATNGTRSLWRGAAYAWRYLGEGGAIMAVVGSGACLQAALGRRARGLVLALPVVVGTAYVIWAGGDVYDHGRFFAPLVPYTCLAMAVSLAAVAPLLARSGRPARAGLAVVALAAFASLANGAVRLARELRAGTPAALVSMVRTADVLAAAALGPDDLIAVHSAGVIPYLLPGRRFVDLLGFADRRIAHGPARFGPPGHDKWDYTYALGERRPALLVVAHPLSAGTPEEYRRWLAERRDYGFVAALYFDPTFQADYRCNRVVSPDGGQEIYSRRRDLAGLRLAPAAAGCARPTVAGVGNTTEDTRAPR
jgi:hypothetical protein